MRPFRFETAGTTEDALRQASALLPDDEAAPRFNYLAGGTNLIDLMKLDVMRPEQLIGIEPLRAEHGRIEQMEDGLWLGAMVRMAEAADDARVRDDYPVIADSLWQAASAQLRNMASLGGNVLQRTRCNYFRDTSYGECNKRKPGSGCAALGGVNRRHAVLGVSERCIATYPGDFGVALAALEAEVALMGVDGRARVIPFEDLHRPYGDTPHIETNLAPGELITGFTIPAGPWTRRSRYVKVRDRESYDFALASAAVALDLDGDGTARTVRIGLGGVATKPWRSREAEEVLTGRRLDEDSARAAAEAAFRDAVTHGGNHFKPELGRRTLVRALLETARMEV
jgi:xanthine dehydrogenase YagS FAD-binding subunit